MKVTIKPAHHTPSEETVPHPAVTPISSGLKHRPELPCQGGSERLNQMVRNGSFIPKSLGRFPLNPGRLLLKV